MQGLAAEVLLKQQPATNKSFMQHHCTGRRDQDALLH